VTVEHDFQRVDSASHTIGNRQYTFWSKFKCSRCNVVMTVASGLISFEDHDGKDIGDESPSCVAP